MAVNFKFLFLYRIGTLRTGKYMYLDVYTNIFDLGAGLLTELRSGTDK